MKLRLYDGTNYLVYTTIIQIMSRKIWKHCNNSRWRVNSIKNLYANWRIYLAEEWLVVLYVFNGKLVFIKITSVTFIIIYSDCKSIQCYPLLAAECANFSIGHYRNPPDPFEILLIFSERVSYIRCAVIVIIMRRRWTLWMTMQVATCWRRTLSIRPSGMILHFRYSILRCRS